MSSSRFNAYPVHGWHGSLKVVYGTLDREIGSSRSWWLGLDRQTFREAVDAAVTGRRRRQARIGLSQGQGPWSD
jgi:hypothetical protein